MPSRFRPALVTALFAMTAGLSLVAAQEDAPSTEEADAAEARDDELPLVATPAEQLAQAESIFAKGQEILEGVQSMLNEARRDRDVLRVTCLEDKAMQIRAHLASAEERIGELGSAIDARDEETREHQYTTLRVIGQKLRTLSREAAQCVGQDAYDVPEAELDSDGPPDAEDPTVLPEMPPPDVPFIPPPASGFS